MALGRRRTSHQGELFVTTADLPQSPGHAFYDRLNRLLAEADFECEAWGVRTYIPEPKRKKRTWTDKPEAWRRAMAANRRRVRGERSKRLQKKRSELVERSFAHVCETGGGRRTWLRGRANVTKRYLIQVAAFNLGVVMRAVFGAGKPRVLQGAAGAAFAAGV
ncbi:MAG TPA: transposase [Urbifossiella sp.]|nr:transposase [Urbifossiella sp.]